MDNKLAIVGSKTARELLKGDKIFTKRRKYINAIGLNFSSAFAEEMTVSEVFSPAIVPVMSSDGGAFKQEVPGFVSVTVEGKINLILYAPEDSSVLYLLALPLDSQTLEDEMKEEKSDFELFYTSIDHPELLQRINEENLNSIRQIHAFIAQLKKAEQEILKKT